MKNYVFSFLLLLGFFSLGFYTNNTEPSHSTLHVINTTHVIRDTLYYTKSGKVTSRYFNSVDDIILFVRYIKTQSNRLDMDNWAVMKTMFNRMRDKGCTWHEYFVNQRYNCSVSIQRMKKNPSMVTFNFANDTDRKLFFRAINASLGNYPEEIRRNIPPNTLYFESFADPNWNRGRKDHFNRDSITVKYRHEFYKGKFQGPKKGKQV